MRLVVQASQLAGDPVSMTLSAFHKQLAGDTLKPVYLIAGAEHLLVIEAADALRARARALGFLEREILDVDAQFDWGRLGDAARSMSLFSSTRLIELRLPGGRPGKDGSAAIVEFCKSPPADTLLLVTANDWSRKHEGAWSSAIERAGTVLTLWPLKRDELPAWIGARAKLRGLTIAADATALLADRVEGNLLAAAQEIDKLAMLHSGAVVDLDALEASVADDARYDVFRLSDAAIGGDTRRALHIISGLRAEGEEVIPLLGWLLAELRKLVRLAGAGANLNSALKAERIWPAPREKLFRHALGEGGLVHWERCLNQVGRIDCIAKGRAEGDVWRELERLICAIAAPRTAAELIA